MEDSRRFRDWPRPLLVVAATIVMTTTETTLTLNDPAPTSGTINIAAQEAKSSPLAASKALIDPRRDELERRWGHGLLDLRVLGR